MKTQELIEKVEELKGSDLETLGRFAFDHLFEIIETLKKYREALEKIKAKADDNLIAAIADDALIPKVVILSGKALEDE